MIRKRVAQPLEKPFSSPFSGGPVITYMKEENHIPIYLSIQHPLFSPEFQDDSSALGLITEQLGPSQKRPTLKIHVIYNHPIHELQSAILLLFPHVSSHLRLPFKASKCLCAVCGGS